MSPNKEHKKITGSFYSPRELADYLAKLMVRAFGDNSKDTPITALDPAVGNSALLIALNKSLKSFTNKHFIGVDTDKEALMKSKSIVRNSQLYSFYQFDALYPSGTEASNGWSTFKTSNDIERFNFIICNPPWGADISSYQHLSTDFELAKGQYDIYDLFVETIVGNLSNGDVYGLILPDSIYRKEHSQTRYMLLRNTTITHIVRVGEFFFDDVNTSVSLIVGRKGHIEGNNVMCLHLSNQDSKDVKSGKATMSSIEKLKKHYIPQCDMENSGNFSIDMTDNDSRLISQIESFPPIDSFLSNTRGVELSKKGIIVQCPICKKWIPKPKEKECRCQHCLSSFNIESAKTETIIGSKHRQKSRGFISGEDLYRYICTSNKHILMDFDGINYKDCSLYASPKILVRKTGVGITSSIDYSNSVTNQVVYVLKRKLECPAHLPIEFFVAALNSRITTYYIIKKYGSSDWCTHPYMSQKMVNCLRVPNIEANDENVRLLDTIVYLVQTFSIGTVDAFNKEADIKIERIIAKFYGIDYSQFKIICETIANVEQLIPFKRLTNITAEEIYGV